MKEKNINISKEELKKCCTSENWVAEMSMRMPFNTKQDLFDHSEKVWYSLDKPDWLEAFSGHPKIGDIGSLNEKFSSTKDIAEYEQSGINDASVNCLEELIKHNEEYERKFGYIFIVCATGKTADEMLSMIKSRIKNNPQDEISIAMEEQNKITKLRLDKLA
ncbi:MAG: 2-oxo-4-hydroxy-4-carboxy-5-ureidoimidazoline decarboxylase [Ignavibacteria bacterium]